MNNYKLTGIKSESIFNTIPSFHVTHNYAVDVMHDALEGIVKYELMNILSFYLGGEVFDLSIFNSRMTNFEYGKLKLSRNKCQAIKNVHIKSKQLHVASRESLKLLHF